MHSVYSIEVLLDVSICKWWKIGAWRLQSSDQQLPAWYQYVTWHVSWRIIYKYRHFCIHGNGAAKFIGFSCKSWVRFHHWLHLQNLLLHNHSGLHGWCQAWMCKTKWQSPADTHVDVQNLMIELLQPQFWCSYNQRVLNQESEPHL